MFVVTEIEDKIEIRASSIEKMIAVTNGIIKKYIGKIMDELGIAVHLYKVSKILEFEIRSDKLIVDVIFSIVFFRFYTEEVCQGRILAQDEDKLILTDGIFRNYEIQALDLFENCEFLFENGINNWIWNYKNSRLVFYDGDLVSFKTKKFRSEDLAVEGYMNDQGLGPKIWWC